MITKHRHLCSVQTRKAAQSRPDPTAQQCATPEIHSRVCAPPSDRTLFTGLPRAGLRLIRLVSHRCLRTAASLLSISIPVRSCVGRPRITNQECTQWSGNNHRNSIVRKSPWLQVGTSWTARINDKRSASVFYEWMTVYFKVEA
jgi:hypothetical protein